MKDIIDDSEPHIFRITKKEWWLDNKKEFMMRIGLVDLYLVLFFVFDFYINFVTDKLIISKYLLLHIVLSPILASILYNATWVYDTFVNGDIKIKINDRTRLPWFNFFTKSFILFQIVSFFSIIISFYY
jgi:hypothetical protein